jgi:acyl carrier protein
MSTAAEMPQIDQIERDLNRIWSDVLQLQEIGPSDGFAALGGDSLAAMRIVFLIKDQFGVELSLSDFFSADTIGKMSALTLAKMSVDPGPGQNDLQSDEGVI